MTARASAAAHSFMVTLLWLILAAGLVVTIRTGAQIRSQTITASADSKSCIPSTLQFWSGTTDRPVTRNELQETITLASNAALHQQVCQLGTLRLRVRGTAAEGVDAQLIVSLGTRNLLTTTATTERSIAIEVDQPGLLAISFVNDRYIPELTTPEDRNVFIRELTFTPRP